MTWLRKTGLIKANVDALYQKEAKITKLIPNLYQKYRPLDDIKMMIKVV